MPVTEPSPTFAESKKHPPNAHPYPIKTTSSAVLSWSNSSPHSVQSVKHYYVPPSPTRRCRGHSSREMSNSESANDVPYPPPLPTPPTFFSGSPTRSSFRSTEISGTLQRRRADTLPPSATNPFMDMDNHSILNGDLPSNPQQWTTEQLVTYLSASLHTCRDSDISRIDDMLDWVRKRGFTGREWLQLTDTDVISTSLSDIQRSCLLENSRTLRTDVLREHNSSKDISVRHQTNTKPSPFHGDPYRMSVSSVDLSLPSGVDFSDPIPPSVTTHRSDSVSESFAQRYRDLARIRTRRRGKVKGLIQTWEQERGRRGSISGGDTSGGDGSVFGSDAESENGGDEGQLETLLDGRSPPLHEEGLLSGADSTIIATGPPWPYINTVDDEPSMEKLLASSGPIEGACAWEADIGLGETVKRIPASSTPDFGNAGLVKSLNPNDATEGPDSNRSLKRDVVRELSLKEMHARVRKRVVTAVFTGTSEPCWDTDAGDPVKKARVVGGSVETDSAPTSLHFACSENTEELDIIRSLETSLAHTRAELQNFKARLEVVETDLTRIETLSSAQQNLDLGRTEEAPKKDAQISTDDGNPTRQAQGVVEIGDLWSLKLDWRHAARSVYTRVTGSIYPYTQLIVHRYHLNLPKHRDNRLALLRARALPTLHVSSVFMFSFFLCVVLFRRVGLNRWLRRP
ncbi:hypothetical protein V8B97DRAFT_1868212 [Scleroderma yunnanense]